MTTSAWLSRADTYLGIDDTDTLESPGTGRLVQELMVELEGDGWGQALGATRHQLLIDPRVPMTSHNCSAAVAWRLADGASIAGLAERVGAFLLANTPVGSDPGLAIATRAEAAPAREALAAFGVRAKGDLLSQGTARLLARQLGIHLSGHGGTEDGVIGALAGVGLHIGGSDGLFLWMPGIRGLAGTSTTADLLDAVPIDHVGPLNGPGPRADEVIKLGNWVRPLHRGAQPPAGRAGSGAFARWAHVAGGGAGGRQAVLSRRVRGALSESLVGLSG